MFDFSMEVGDVFEGRFHKLEGFEVIERDSMEMLNGGKRLALTLRKDQYETVWIEGVGDTGFGIDLMHIVGIEPTGYGLSCIGDDNGLIFKGSVYSDAICDSIGCITSFAEFDFSTDKLKSTFENYSLFASSNIWDFGDGTTSTDINPIHDYNEPGCYNVKLTTGDNCTSIVRESELVNNVCIDNAWKKNISTMGNSFFNVKEFNGITFGMKFSEIYRSDDFLETWDVISIPLPAIGSRTIQDLKMFDSQRGILVCTNYQTGEDQQGVFYTQDGGLTWEHPETKSYWLTSCETLKDGVAIAYGPYAYYRTEDYGLTWTELEINDQWGIIDGIQFMNNSTLIGTGFNSYAPNQRSYLVKSTDLGLSFDTTHVPDAIFKTYFIDDQLGFGFSRYANELHKTEDGGLSWALINQSMKIGNMFFLEDGIGLVNTINGKTLYTENYMEDYVEVQCSNKPINEIVGESIDRLWSLKEGNIVQYKPEILVDCNKTSIPKIDLDFDLVIYPNPVSTKINLDGLGLLTGSITNGLGEFIEILNFNSDSKHQEVDLSELPNGIYFFTLNNVNGKTVSKKVVKI